MEINIKHTDLFDCGLYLLNQDRAAYKPYPHESSIYLTQEQNTTLKNEVLKLVHNSVEVLKVCSFIITDKEIFEAILNKAQNSNTSVFILTQLDKSKLTDSFSLLDYLTEEEIKESTALTHLKYIKILFDNGVHVRASISAHAKFIIADRNTGFLTSANLTTASLSLNTESGIYLNDSSCTELDKLFDVIFQKGTSYRQFLSSNKRNKVLIVQAEMKMQRELLPITNASQLRFTYEDLTNNLYDELISVIDSAAEYLYLSSFSIVGLELLQELTNALKEAVLRGVRVFVFCRGMNYRHDHLLGSQILHSCGAEIFGDIYNHSKGIINESRGMLFTANIDGHHGLKNGFEVGCILDEKQRNDFLEIHKYLIETSYYRFNNKSERIAFFTTYIDYELKKGLNAPLFQQDLMIKIKENLIGTENPLTQYPIFYGKSKDEEFIISGDNYFRCKSSNNVIEIIEIIKARFDLDRYCIKYVNLKIVSN